MFLFFRSFFYDRCDLSIYVKDEVGGRSVNWDVYKRHTDMIRFKVCLHWLFQISLSGHLTARVSCLIRLLFSNGKCSVLSSLSDVSQKKLYTKSHSHIDDQMLGRQQETEIKPFTYAIGINLRFSFLPKDTIRGIEPPTFSLVDDRSYPRAAQCFKMSEINLLLTEMTAKNEWRKRDPTRITDFNWAPVSQLNSQWCRPLPRRPWSGWSTPQCPGPCVH